MYRPLGHWPSLDAPVTQESSFPPHYKPQFAANRDLILRRIGTAEKAKEEPKVKTQNGDINTSTDPYNAFTLPLPGEIPPLPEEEPPAAVDRAAEPIDFSQPTIFYQEPMPEDHVPVILSGPLEEQRQQWLASLPDGVAPAKAGLVGFTAGEASTRTLTEYFYGKKRTDLLNILSFCDQLEPQLLVDLLVSVSRKHPDLRIFESPDWEATILAAEVSRAAAMQLSRIRQRPRHGHTLLNPRMRKRGKAAVKKMVELANMTPAEKAAKITQEDEEDGEEEEPEEDVLPETWPQAGKGLYAKLPLETEDRSYLADEGDDDAFSHFMVDVFGRQTAVRACG